MEYQEGDVILCTVERIEQATVFVKLPDGQTGTIIINEIAAGRIRNLRAHVVPNKKIVCKVLRIKGDHIDLSLRRVTSKEKAQVMQKYKQEQSLKSALHSLLKDKAQEIEEKIKKDMSLSEFAEKAKQDESLIKKYIPKEYEQAIQKILTKKSKQTQIKKTIKLSCTQDSGLNTIKKLLDSKDKTIKYISAGKYTISITSDNPKQAQKNLDNYLEDLEKQAKENNCEFEIIESK